MIPDEFKYLDELKKLYADNIRLEEDIAEVKKKMQHNYELLIKTLYPLLEHRYREWRPELGEKVMYVGIDNKIAFEVIIREINGYWVSAQEGKKPCYQSFSLKVEPDKWELPRFIIPMDFYDKIKDIFHSLERIDL